MTRLLASVVAQAALLYSASCCWADFVLTTQGQTSTWALASHTGLAPRSGGWWMTTPSSNRLRRYDEQFTFLSSIPLSPADSLNGIDNDPVTGNLFVGAFPSALFEVNANGGFVRYTLLNSDPNLGAGGVTFDASSNTIYVVRGTNQGRVDRLDRTGALMSTVLFGRRLAAIEFDTVSRTVLALAEGGALLEFSPDGSLIREHLPAGVMDGNPLELDYSAQTGRLHVISQDGTYYVFDDPTRVPAPSTALLVGGLVAIRTLPRRRRS